jgi:hypothetical protein
VTIFRILQATQKLVDGYLIGVLNTSSNDGGSTFVGVRKGDALDQFHVKVGETHTLADNWTFRLISVKPPLSDHGKSILEVELCGPVIGTIA